MVMRWEAGNEAISWLANLITWFLNFAQYGARAVFGETYTDHTFAMAVVMLFFTSYYQNVIVVVNKASAL